MQETYSFSSFFFFKGKVKIRRETSFIFVLWKLRRFNLLLRHANKKIPFLRENSMDEA
jgi:hypothetical protein